MGNLRISQRAQRVEPFYVMEVAKAAAEMARQAAPGTPSMIYLNIGEPDFTAPPQVQAAAERAIRAGRRTARMANPSTVSSTAVAVSPRRRWSVCVLLLSRCACCVPV